MSRASLRPPGVAGHWSVRLVVLSALLAAVKNLVLAGWAFRLYAGRGRPSPLWGVDQHSSEVRSRTSVTGATRRSSVELSLRGGPFRFGRAVPCGPLPCLGVMVGTAFHRPLCWGGCRAMLGREPAGTYPAWLPNAPSWRSSAPRPVCGAIQLCVRGLPVMAEASRIWGVRGSALGAHVDKLPVRIADRFASYSSSILISS